MSPLKSFFLPEKAKFMSHTTNKWSSIILVTGILFIAINLRVPFTAIAPVLASIRHDFGLSIT
ncbi:MFS transporter, partial [Citrobacter freundii]